MSVLVKAISLQICFCLFGGGVGAENISWHCTMPVLWLFLTEIDGICVFVSELCMRDKHTEKKSQKLFSQEAFCYSGLTQCCVGGQVLKCVMN